MNREQSNLLLVCLLLVIDGLANGAGAKDDGQIRLLVRADDIGSSHAANVACIRSFRDGIARSIEVMVPCPWFNEAVTMLNDNPGCDVGVHLTLTSEWTNIKWRPITGGRSLVDEQGNFYPTTSSRSGSPGLLGFLQAEPKLEEVEEELRAQIELAKSKIRNVSHLSAHMGTPVCTPELRTLVNGLAIEYGLRIEFPDLQRAGRWSGKEKSSEEKIAALVNLLENLEPGNWLIVEHPGMDTPEMRAIGHPGYENVAADRQGVTDAFTSERVREVIHRRKIELISYGDLLRD